MYVAGIRPGLPQEAAVPLAATFPVTALATIRQAEIAPTALAALDYR